MNDENSESSWPTTDVIICGCGPTGAMLSAHLGRLKVRNVVLEKEAEIPTDPRGIALDEDGIRALQSLGLYDKVYSEIGRCMGVFNFVGGVHHDLSTKPFMRMNYGTTEGGTGHVGFICHKQPVLEANLRCAMQTTGQCDLHLSSTLKSISEDDNWVYVTYEDGQGVDQRLRAKFMVGADGKTGFTRKKYLEAKGIQMEQASRLHYQETWVALNWKMTLPTPETHPQFPLWQLGYIPEQVWDQFFPEEFRFLCNPERPAVCGRFGLPEDRLWRFEFVIRAGEDGMQMAMPEKIKEIVHPYITHPGRRYGLSQDIIFPLDCIEVLRSRPFYFSARSCNKWALNRVILCGDSAHVFPPFGGQGIASGFRDACALAWRLQVACRPGFRNYDPLFTGWYTERKQQLERSLAATVENGRYVTEGNWLKIQFRNTILRLVQLIPSWRHWLEMGQRREGMVKYEYQPGVAFLPEFGGGKCFPQVYCVPLASQDARSDVESVSFTDDVIFAPQKRGLFQLCALIDRQCEIEDSQAVLSNIDQLADGQLFAEEATFIVHEFGNPPEAGKEDKDTSQHLRNLASNQNLVRIASSWVFAQSKLCRNRPAPEYFDSFRLKNEFKDKTYIILRPDRFVFAACANIRELEEATKQISRVLDGR